MNDGIFGIIRPIVRVRDWSNEEAKEELESLGIVDVEDKDIEDIVDELVEQRKISRAERNWEEADRIRDMLLEMGVAVEDMKDGTKWWWKGKKRLKMKD